MEKLSPHKKLILFDGVCNLCNSSIQFIIKRDKKHIFLFAPLQAEAAKPILEDLDADIRNTDSILLFDPQKGFYTKSTAALKIAKHLGFPTYLLFAFIIVPAFIRNAVYDYIAKNRYKWYGKREACMIPSPEVTSKFLK